MTIISIKDLFNGKFEVEYSTKHYKHWWWPFRPYTKINTVILKDDGVTFMTTGQNSYLKADGTTTPNGDPLSKAVDIWRNKKRF